MITFILRLFNFFIGLIEFMLTARFILRFLGANPSTPIVNWVYQNTQPLLQPFLFAFPSPVLEGGYVIEFNTLFAIFTYALLGYVIQELILAFNRRVVVYEE